MLYVFVSNLLASLLFAIVLAEPGGVVTFCWIIVGATALTVTEFGLSAYVNNRLLKRRAS